MSQKQKQDLYIRQKILTIRNTQVMLDSDLAVLYNVETRVLNQAVKRNIKRFPKEFMFQLTKKEFDHLKLSYFFPDGTLSQDKKEITTLQKSYENPNLKSQIVTSSSKHGGRRKFDLSHDRFLIIDHQEIYHIGASLKDLGKKWFAFSKFETNTIDILNKLIK